MYFNDKYTNPYLPTPFWDSRGPWWCRGPSSQGTYAQSYTHKNIMSTGWIWSSCWYLGCHFPREKKFTEHGRDGNFDTFRQNSYVPRNGKCSEFRSEPFRRRYKKLGIKFRTIPRNIKMLGIPFRTISQKRKTLKISFRTSERKKKFWNLRWCLHDAFFYLWM
jgi:hypothetical protein